MNNIQSFLLGFAIAGLVGWLSSLLVASWTTTEKTRKRMFVNIPKPALKPITDSRNRTIGTDPDQSPIEVLSQGCLSLIGQVILQAAFLFALGIICFFGLQLELTEKFLVGVIFAVLVGYLVQEIRLNWKKITQLYKMVTNPPVPSLKQEIGSPPNSHYAAAILAPPPPPPPPYPPLPPFTVVVEGSFQIGLRLIWQLILFYLLYRSFLAMYFYLRGEPVIQGGAVLGV